MFLGQRLEAGQLARGADPVGETAGAAARYECLEAGEGEEVDAEA